MKEKQSLGGCSVRVSKLCEEYLQETQESKEEKKEPAQIQCQEKGTTLRKEVRLGNWQNGEEWHE